MGRERAYLLGLANLGLSLLDGLLGNSLGLERG